MFFKLFFIFCCLSVFSYAETPKIMSFDQKDWDSFHQQDVVIRGFLYQIKEDQWVLAAEPNLKSCCIGNLDKPQIFVSGELAISTNRPVVIQGKFFVESLHSQDGELKQRFILENANMVFDQSTHWPIKSLVIIFLALSLGIGFFLVKKILRNLIQHG